MSLLLLLLRFCESVPVNSTYDPEENQKDDYFLIDYFVNRALPAEEHRPDPHIIRKSSLIHFILVAIRRSIGRHGRIAY